MSGQLTNNTNDYGLVLRNGNGLDNAQPQNSIGSAYVNDVYLRSVGKFASQIGGIKKSLQVQGPNACAYNNSIAYCPSGYRVTGGGYSLTAYGNPHNSPERAGMTGNGYYVTAARDSCFVAYAICAQ